MPNRYDPEDKREKAIAACLDQFVTKGLYETTSRDLSKALKLQSGGMYHYFSNKDQAVIMCAEEAAFLLEKHLIAYALGAVNNPDEMMKEVLVRAKALSPMMRFFVQVCSVSKYREQIEPVLARLRDRYSEYLTQLSKNSVAIKMKSSLIFICA